MTINCRQLLQIIGLIVKNILKSPKDNTKTAFNYYVQKDDYTGDLYFYRCPMQVLPYENHEELPKGWKQIVKPRRPKVTQVPLKM